MEPVDLNAVADAYAAAPLLNCLLREAAEPVGPDEPAGVHEPAGAAVHRLRGSGRLLRVRGGRRPVYPELRTANGWHPLSHTELVKLVGHHLRRVHRVTKPRQPGQMNQTPPPPG
ncbi:hypothetical protein ACFVZX_33115, partial [Streptomyces erythrochromogenes]